MHLATTAASPTTPTSSPPTAAATLLRTHARQNTKAELQFDTEPVSSALPTFISPDPNLSGYSLQGRALLYHLQHCKPPA